LYFYFSRPHLALPSFPTRRSSDLLRLGREPDLREHAHDARGDRRAPRPRHLEREGHVLLGRAVLEQPEILEHDAQPAPQPRDVRSEEHTSELQSLAYLV